MLKYAGIILFSLTISAYGAHLSSTIKATRLTRSEILRFIKHIESSIKYGCTPLEEIFSSFSSAQLTKIGFMSRIYGKSYSKETTDDVLVSLNSKERQIIENFFINLGKSHYADLELNLCRSTYEKLNEVFTKSEKEDEARAVLYKKLGIIAALLSAIIFL